jgi:hypothetical protein
MYDRTSRSKYACFTYTKVPLSDQASAVAKSALALRVKRQSAEVKVGHSWKLPGEILVGPSPYTPTTRAEVGHGMTVSRVSHAWDHTLLTRRGEAGRRTSEPGFSRKDRLAVDREPSPHRKQRALDLWVN